MVFFRERVSGLLRRNPHPSVERSVRSGADLGMRFLSRWLGLTALCLSAVCVSAEDFTRTQAQAFQEPTFLPVDEAFVIRADRADSGAVQITWDIAPGYYLYRHQFSVRVDDVEMDALQIPSGVEKFDEFFGDVEVFYQFAELTLAENVVLEEGARLAVMYQGCADLGLCYPPEQRHYIHTMGRLLPAAAGLSAVEQPPQVVGEDRALANVLAEASLITVLAVFFLAGVGLTFTPCVFPMLPILSSIIVGQGADLAKRRALSLSAAYVLGMALTFAGVGLLVGLFGAELNLQAKLQSPVVLILSALIFTLLAGAMFGLYELSLPQGLQQWLDDRARAQQAQVAAGSSHRAVFVMGALSSLVVSPCITPPLAGALIYLSNTGDVALGGGALFTLALGMGVPLMIVGGTGGHWLPRAGSWMDLVKAAFGVGLLAVAIWLLARLLPPALVLLLWGGLLIGCGVFLGALVFSEQKQGQKSLQVVGIIALAWGVMCVVGAGLGGTDPLKPLDAFARDTRLDGGSEQALEWRGVKSLADVRQAVQVSQRPVLLDVYADWCVSCKVMEEEVFPTMAVAPLLGRFQLLRADVTRNDALDRELLNHYGLFGPPSLVFFRSDSSEIDEFRLQGEVSEQQLAPHLEAVLSRFDAGAD